MINVITATRIFFVLTCLLYWDSEAGWACRLDPERWGDHSGTGCLGILGAASPCVFPWAALQQEAGTVGGE